VINLKNKIIALFCRIAILQVVDKETWLAFSLIYYQN